ncbi:hypothetical protein DV872_25895 [Oceanispirochaeta sp. M1]|nr:hypothetical protein DV872_25895 [Oceanispirochaeta sp. M1]
MADAFLLRRQDFRHVRKTGYADVETVEKASFSTVLMKSMVKFRKRRFILWQDTKSILMTRL